MLELEGHEVSREYYFNNAGSQIDKLGESVRLRARKEPVPEDGGFYVGDYVDRARDEDPGRRRDGRGRARREGLRADHGGDPGDAAPLPGRVRHVLPRGLAARRRSVADRGRVRPAARAGAPVRVRGCAVAADDRLRRRQGPRAQAPDRRADLLRRRRRLPGGQVPARLRPGDLRARRRPPRLHRAAEGDRGLRWARTRTGSRSRSCSSCTSSRAAAGRRCPSAAATS